MAMYRIQTAAQQKVQNHIVLICYYDVRTRSAVEEEVDAKLPVMVVQLPHHGSVERQLVAGPDHRAFQVFSCKLLEALELLCLCSLGAWGQDMEPALRRPYLRVEEKAAALPVVQLPGDRMEGALHNGLDFGTVQKGFGDDKFNFLVVQ